MEAAPVPLEYWIELTSRCPFDCVFCSRRLRRGGGEDMDFGLFRALIAQAGSPDVIRLNYSGESGHYPRLLEAIELAAATGAETELVTALASIPPHTLDDLAKSPLGRVSVSLHTLDAAEFRPIYGYGSFEAMRARIEKLRGGRPRVDFAFVAMERNLAQLPAVAAYARELGIGDIYVHPVLRRDPIPELFAIEQAAGFAQRVAAATDDVQRRYPDLRIAMAATDGSMPAGTKIRTCDQSPWHTAHVLANGDVVACEVHDHVALGNLRQTALREIWHGEAYRAFRSRYREGEDAKCRACPWKTVYVPAPAAERLADEDRDSPQFTWGWHTRDAGALWSRPESAIVLGRAPGASRVRITGLLPREARRLVIETDAGGHTSVKAGREAIGTFSATLPLSGSAGICRVRFRTEGSLRPSRTGLNADKRLLGFVLRSAETYRPRPRVTRALAAGICAALRIADWTCTVARRLFVRRVAEGRSWEPGVSVIIPERDNPELLAACLESLRPALAMLREPSEIIVRVNGTRRENYAGLARRFPGVSWLCSRSPLGFSAAIRSALPCARYDWVYLLNNDMTVEPATIAEAMLHRGTRVFAVASQILPRDPSCGREETNWTDVRFETGIAEAIELTPDGAGLRPGYYAGGGSALFRKSLLARVARTTAYDPFYWEDVEWGAVARKMGCEVWFCPASRVVHVRRATVSKYYTVREVDRVFERNRLLFQLRNATHAGSRRAVLERLASSDWRTVAEVIGRLPGVFAARARSHFLPLTDAGLGQIGGAEG